MSDQRIQITRTQLVAQFIEVSNPPAVLEETFQKPPFCHLLSKYIIRPVACDQKPFFIHHKNKQQILVAQPFAKKKFNKKNQGEVDDFDAEPKEQEQAASSDDEFETVTGDNKRVANQKKKFIEQAPAVEANPLFPASDPGRVKVIEHKKKDPIATKEKKESKQKTQDVDAATEVKTDPVEPAKQAPAAKVAPVPKVKIEKALAVAEKPNEEWSKAPASARGATKKDKPLVKGKNEDNKEDMRAATARAAPAAKKPKVDAASNDIFRQFQMANTGTKPDVQIPNQDQPSNNKEGVDNKGKGGKKDKSDQQTKPKEEAPKKVKKSAQEKKAPQEEQKETIKPKSAKPAAAPKENILEQNKKEQVQKNGAKAAKIDDIIKTQEKQAKKQIEEKKQEIKTIDPFDFKAQMELGNKLSEMQVEANKEKRALKAQKKGKGAAVQSGAPSKQPVAASTKKSYGSQKSEFEMMMDKR